MSRPRRLALVVAAVCLAGLAALAGWWFTRAPLATFPLHGPLDAERSAALVAALDGADRPLLILIDSEGGPTPEATRVLEAIERAQARKVWVGAWVQGQAFGWAALVALAADGCYCKPDARLGRARPFRTTEGLDPATQRSLTSQARSGFEQVAVRQKRNIAAAGSLVENDMVLSGRDAVQYQLADGTAETIDEIVRRMGG